MAIKGQIKSLKRELASDDVKKEHNKDDVKKLKTVDESSNEEEEKNDILRDFHLQQKKYAQRKLDPAGKGVG